MRRPPDRRLQPPNALPPRVEVRILQARLQQEPDSSAAQAAPIWSLMRAVVGAVLLGALGCVGASSTSPVPPGLSLASAALIALAADPQVPPPDTTAMCLGTTGALRLDAADWTAIQAVYPHAHEIARCDADPDAQWGVILLDSVSSDQGQHATAWGTQIGEHANVWRCDMTRTPAGWQGAPCQYRGRAPQDRPVIE